MICKSEKKQTNDHRLIISDLNRGIIPKNWTLYKIPPNTTVIQWINDFSMRIKQLEEISKVRKFNNKKMKYLNNVLEDRTHKYNHRFVSNNKIRVYHN